MKGFYYCSYSWFDLDLQEVVDRVSVFPSMWKENPLHAQTYSLVHNSAVTPEMLVYCNNF